MYVCIQNGCVHAVRGGVMEMGSLWLLACGALQVIALCFCFRKTTLSLYTVQWGLCLNCSALLYANIWKKWLKGIHVKPDALTDLSLWFGSRVFLVSGLFLFFPSIPISLWGIHILPVYFLFRRWTRDTVICDHISLSDPGTRKC